ncbi:Transcription factor IIIB 70 kDa subunit (TFIIIB) (B-related factor) (BRF) [Scheffersomyces stipitis CBS 6054]|uniref:B-related factor 1 n=1 Tax=Scheffersomyces stipitis (strain ATCC 58785 / CBS 6054 / NBRC 10063 / NRRL Y-11545) TaxID=322104 RepID=A3LP89_PICST|nr:Transcription factor IIIB 70 kDa subunit (TFIIIB) (B-related factor) (BRF) [Scheffersomyces stipitis CBS 6054]ABN64454.2 Transcription factor IIIB 70 kDa subunit (TFIIIB) (B-related factor) (BRF) [Scheffersomyces stipitis CBS 6054]KAG2736194.1 hypothetical protein G9P44_000284 [Scheffersomyces stipitis]
MSSKVKKCANCGHTAFTRDRFTNAGDISCLRCGTVMEENPIVSEVQFGESSSGAAMVQGAMVGADQARASYGGRQNAMESREQTLSNGKRKIRKIAHALKIADYIAESAGGWFKLALTQNFVQGRRSQNVLAACLYVACRKERTHHMLIDFSSRLQISVYSLGATFLKLVKALNIVKLPLADPSIFIQHFAEKLDFKEKATKVVKDAVKLAHQMSSDWIDAGRRPAGIAGACVLLAARMNNFRRTHSEIVAVAHVAEETLQKRLNEFKKTASGVLTVSQFRESEGTISSQPPSFTSNRDREDKLRIEVAVKEATLKRFKEYAEDNRFSDEPPDFSKIPADPEHNNASKMQRQQRLLRRDQLEKDTLLRTILSDCSFTVDTLTEELERIISKKKDELTGALYITPSDSKGVGQSEFAEKCEMNKPRNLVKNLPKTQDILAKVSSSTELNSDDDDEVVLESELTPEEASIKERIWTGLNHDFMVAQERKRLKQEADELTGNTSGTTRKKRARTAPEVVQEYGVKDALSVIGVDERTGEALTAAESAKIMLSKKSFSKKINYDRIDDLFSNSM